MDLRVQHDVNCCQLQPRNNVQTSASSILCHPSFLVTVSSVFVRQVRVVPRRDRSTVVNVVVAVSKKVKPFYRFCDNLEQIGLGGMRIIFVFHENDVNEVRHLAFPGARDNYWVLDDSVASKSAPFVILYRYNIRIT